jgi:hypothetical protein
MDTEGILGASGLTSAAKRLYSAWAALLADLGRRGSDFTRNVDFWGYCTDGARNTWVTHVRFVAGAGVWLRCRLWREGRDLTPSTAYR